MTYINQLHCTHRGGSSGFPCSSSSSSSELTSDAFLLCTVCLMYGKCFMRFTVPVSGVGVFDLHIWAGLVGYVSAGRSSSLNCCLSTYPYRLAPKPTPFFDIRLELGGDSSSCLITPAGAAKLPRPPPPAEVFSLICTVVKIKTDEDSAESIGTSGRS
jgi:hypothetical protein